MKITCEPMRNYLIILELSREDALAILKDFDGESLQTEQTKIFIKELNRVAGIGMRPIGVIGESE